MNLLLATIALSSISAALAQSSDKKLSILADIDNKWIQEHVLLGVVAPLNNTNSASGEDLELHCEIGGTPVPSIHWTFQGKIIQGAPTINWVEKLLNRGRQPTETGITVSVLRVPCAQSENSGEYKCIGYNGYKTVESTAQVVIDGESKCKSKPVIAPQIIEWTDSRVENQGNDATIVCRADKAANWTWTFEDHQIQNGDRYNIMPNGNLFIRNLTFADLGAYYCTASNQFGNSTAENYLHVTSSHS